MTSDLFNTNEYHYILLFVLVLLLPKALLRFRIPVGITALILGIGTGNLVDWFQNDQLVLLLSRLGITALFLFAGMEIDLDELKKDLPGLSKSLVNSILITIAAAFGIRYFFSLELRPAMILAIGLFTPSAGFILHSLKSFNFSGEQEYLIRSKAISKEIAAVLLLFLTLQSENLKTFVISKAVLIFLIILLPLIFRFFLKAIAPYAPKSEVSFLVLVAFVAGVITKKIGTYYLVGAFITGIVAGQFKHFIDSDESERILNSISAFFSIFIPFYFFNVGLSITKSYFTWQGLMIGLLFLVLIIPVRIGSIISSIKLFISGYWEDRYKVSLALTPTLIFGLVVSIILKEKFNMPDEILSGLLCYTILASLIPTFIFKKASPEAFDTSLR